MPVRIGRASGALSSLPDWPRWHTRENHTGLRQGQLELEPGKCGWLLCEGVSEKTVAVCRVGIWPTEEATEDEGLAKQAVWITPQLSDTVPVDMSPPPAAVLGLRYRETLAGSQVALFVKSTLVRTRASGDPERQTCLRALLVAPEELDKKYEEAFSSAADSREEFALGGPRHRREAQLQIVLRLELLTADEKVSKIEIDLFFDRLVIWQAVDAPMGELQTFCFDVLLPFYRATLPDLVTALNARAGGVKPEISLRRKSKASLATPRSADGATRAAQLLRRVQSFNKNDSFPVHTEPVAYPAVRKLSRSLEVSRRRSVETSLGPIKRERSETIELKPRKVVRSPPRVQKAQRQPTEVDVEATPISQRTLKLPLVHIPLDITIDSDGEAETPLFDTIQQNAKR